MKYAWVEPLKDNAKTVNGFIYKHKPNKLRVDQGK